MIESDNQIVPTTNNKKISGSATNPRLNESITTLSPGILLCSQFPFLTYHRLRKRQLKKFKELQTIQNQIKEFREQR